MARQLLVTQLLGQQNNEVKVIKLASFVLSRPSLQIPAVQFQMYRGLLKTWKLETGTRQDKTHRNWDEIRQNCLVLSPVVFTLPTGTRQSCVVRVGGVNKL